MVRILFCTIAAAVMAAAPALAVAGPLGVGSGGTTVQTINGGGSVAGSDVKTFAPPDLTTEVSRSRQQPSEAGLSETVFVAI
jgi:hypothetical protein